MDIKMMIDLKEPYFLEFADDNNPNPLYTSRGDAIQSFCFTTFNREKMKLLYIKELEGELKKLKKEDKGDEITDKKRQKFLNRSQETLVALMDTRDEMKVADHFYKGISGGIKYILPAKKNSSGKVKTYSSKEADDLLKQMATL
jgi:hypothetical protein